MDRPRGNKIAAVYFEKNGAIFAYDGKMSPRNNRLTFPSVYPAIN
jgi:hypothetical protein